MIGELCEHGVLLSRCPKDHRDQRQKLQDLIRYGATEGEREAARRALVRIDASGPRAETPAPDPADDILAAIRATPSRAPARGVRIRYPSGVWMHLDEDQVDWEMVDAHRLRWRFDGDTKEFTGKYGMSADEVLRRRGAGLPGKEGAR